MSYRRSSPLGETTSAGRPRAGGTAGGTTVVSVTKGAGTPRVLTAGTVVNDYRGTTHTFNTGTAVNYGGADTQEHRASQDPAYLEAQSVLEQQAAATQAGIDSRKKFITIGAVAAAGLAAFVILRRKKGQST